ncbi:hypothetical protein FA15DRAFT_671691 [Coprinopsis marcescibilis]|uniref:Uncharacterized protein n=1 Tax=Coprinopsis marcescibilis TaxID=230819 RepID=A0A5C3KP61_COPMA|nr:hypothetical protein FA15DRAFT_671691 [Coprinopsis marcescibilis]
MVAIRFIGHSTVQKRRRNPTISTFDPEKLTNSDLVDLSEVYAARISSSRQAASTTNPRPSTSTSLSSPITNESESPLQHSIQIKYCKHYNADGEWQLCKFPPNTRGFLYFYRGEGGATKERPGSLPERSRSSLSDEATMPPRLCENALLSSSSAIRFRVIDSSSSSDLGSDYASPSSNSATLAFTEGRDLDTPSGRPWQIPLHALLSFPIHHPLRDALQAQGMLPTHLVELVDGLKNGHGDCVFETLADPFLCDLESKRFSYVVRTAGHAGCDTQGRKGLMTLRLQLVHRSRELAGVSTGYSGLAILQLQRLAPSPSSPPVAPSTIPPTKSKRATRFRTPPLVLRVLRVLTTPSPTDVGAQNAGELFKLHIPASTTSTIDPSTSHTPDALSYDQGHEETWTYNPKQLDSLPGSLLGGLKRVGMEDVIGYSLGTMEE